MAFGRVVIKVLACVLGGALLLKALDLGAGPLFVSRTEHRYAMAFAPNSKLEFETTDFKYTLFTNNLGLRERPLAPKADPGVYRILCIGDSFTLGWGVTDEKAWVRLIEGLVKSPDGRPVQTVNGGNAGASLHQYAALASEAIPVLRPDLVIVCVHQLDDFLQLAMEDQTSIRAVRFGRESALAYVPNLWRLCGGGSAVGAGYAPITMNAEAVRQGFAATAAQMLAGAPPERRSRFDSLDADVKEAFRSGRMNPVMIDLESTAADLTKWRGLLFADTADPVMKRAVDDAVAALRRIKRMATGVGAQMVLTAAPAQEYGGAVEQARLARLGSDLDTGIVGLGAPSAVMKQMADTVGVPYIEVAQAIHAADADGAMFYPIDGHLTEAGNKLFADEIGRQLAGVLSSR